MQEDIAKAIGRQTAATLNNAKCWSRYGGFVGLDVHKDTIAVAIAEPGREEPARGRFVMTVGPFHGLGSGQGLPGFVNMLRFLTSVFALTIASIASLAIREILIQERDLSQALTPMFAVLVLLFVVRIVWLRSSERRVLLDRTEALFRLGLEKRQVRQDSETGQNSQNQRGSGKPSSL